MKREYYIWSFEHDAWWAPNERGYVSDFHAAGKYPEERAYEIVKDANRGFNNGFDEMPNEAMVPVVGSEA